tara:strand:- start:551 stop:778 length:228 start_codon:yes stop_codon:yes gene_type:complete
MAFLWSKHRFAYYWFGAVSMSLFFSLEQGYLIYINTFFLFCFNHVVLNLRFLFFILLNFDKNNDTREKTEKARVS